MDEYELLNNNQHMKEWDILNVKDGFIEATIEIIWFVSEWFIFNTEYVLFNYLTVNSWEWLYLDTTAVNKIRRKDLEQIIIKDIP